MSKDALFCTIMTNGKRCNRFAFLRCAECQRAICGRHAIRVKLFGGTRWICTACRGKRFSLFSLANKLTHS